MYSRWPVFYELLPCHRRMIALCIKRLPSNVTAVVTYRFTHYKNRGHATCKLETDRRNSYICATLSRVKNACALLVGTPYSCSFYVSMKVTDTCIVSVGRRVYGCGNGVP